MLKATICIVQVLLLCPFLSAQVDSRAAEIQTARLKKAQNLELDLPTGTERALVYVEDEKIIERISAGIAGFRVKLGGLVSGSGFALGPEYLRRDLASGEVIFRGAAQSSFKGYRKYDLQFSLPGFASDRLFLDFYSVRRNYPGINYYGPGPDSQRDSRSNFRLEDMEFNGTFGVRPIPHLNIGTSLAYLIMNVGPGTDSRFISSDEIFTPAETPGIERQANFLRHGAFAQYDYRDNPGGPRSGGNYIVQY
ncbi:MAG: hypothetical protein O7E51_14260, partial [Acidobacteria bacterium]|nr:hypothetical protein [Acidobacteriota bacterium]